MMFIILNTNSPFGTLHWTSHIGTRLPGGTVYLVGLSLKLSSLAGFVCDIELTSEF